MGLTILQLISSRFPRRPTATKKLNTSPNLTGMRTCKGCRPKSPDRHIKVSLQTEMCRQQSAHRQTWGRHSSLEQTPALWDASQIQITERQTFPCRKRHMKFQQSRFSSITGKSEQETLLVFVPPRTRVSHAGALIHRQSCTSGNSLLHLCWGFSPVLVLHHFPWLQLLRYFL